jgi:hypothetical protein
MEKVSAFDYFMVFATSASFVVVGLVAYVGLCFIADLAR